MGYVWRKNVISTFTQTFPQGGQRSGSAGAAGVGSLASYSRTYGGCLLTWGFWPRLKGMLSSHCASQSDDSLLWLCYSVQIGCFSSVWIQLFTSEKHVWKCTKWTISTTNLQKRLNLIITRLLMMIKKKKRFSKRECVCCESRASVCLCVKLFWDNYSASGWMRSVDEFFVCLYESGREEQVEGTERRSRGTWASDSPDEI